VFYLLLLLYTSHKWDHPLYGFLNASIATSSYIVAVYVNAVWLLPRFLQKGKTYAYVFLSLGFLAGLVLLRMTAEAKFLMPIHKTFYTWQWAHFSFNAITILIAFLFGALLRVFLNYLQLVQQKNELQEKQSEAELNLLKAQVQPHFLFNTLNNIYSLAQSHSGKTPEMIAKLSELMRYFIDEAPKQKLPLSTELNFIRNYVELEQIRMLHPVWVDWKIDEQLLTTSIPPMLLMPFVENVFKHGIDKLTERNCMQVILRQKGNDLFYEVRNSLGNVTESGGSGLENLRKRLDLLFGHHYTMRTEKHSNEYIASLQIPLV
jgi:LytS/YehU family sensor histidine kinase